MYQRMSRFHIYLGTIRDTAQAKGRTKLYSQSKKSEGCYAVWQV